MKIRVGENTTNCIKHNINFSLVILHISQYVCLYNAYILPHFIIIGGIITFILKSFNSLSMVVLPKFLSMEILINPQNQENKQGIVSSGHDYFKGVITTLRSKLIYFAKTTKKIGEDDPRRIVHSMKVGLALTLVSLLYYFRPLYNGFGQAGMWAILTVVVVFEFTVGGTLSKSLNRSCATMVAGALGIGAEYLANLCGERGEPVILAILVFVLATTATFTRFHPSVKRKCDYGVLIFILTFTLVAVSGFRVSQILQLAHQRLVTIFIGGATCMIISIFVYPVWAGQDLHQLIATNIEKLALYLEGFGGEVFDSPVDNNGKSCLQLLGYKSVLNSKTTEESLANFAWWEPGHGGFRFNHPWKQYLKIGALASECACRIKALDGYAYNSKLKAASEIFKKLQKPCTTMSSESAKALQDLASAIKILKCPSSANQTHVKNSKSAADEFKSILKNISSPQQNLQEIMQLLVVASVLVDISKCVERISESVHELSKRAGFQEQTPRGNESC